MTTEHEPAPAFRRTPPPPLRPLEVISTTARSARMMRVVVGGPELAGLRIAEPAASVRLMVPWPGEPFELPTWNGNEFLLADGRRPALRTFTPVAIDPARLHLTLDVVRHAGGAISGWTETAAPGDPCAVSGPGRGETIDETAHRYVLLGDETAIPAIEQLLGAIPATIEVEIHVEIVNDSARLTLPDHSNAAVTWHVIDPDRVPGSTLQQAVRDTTVDETTRVWAAGEAAALQAMRKHLFNERGTPRSHTTLRGYWKVPRALDRRGSGSPVDT